MILLISNHSEYLRSIENTLKKHSVPYTLRDQSSSLSDVSKDKIKGIILSGGGPGLTDKINLQTIRADIASLLQFDVPTFGICLGHQIIAELFGGTVAELEKEIHADNNITLLTKEGIFKGLPQKILGHESHGKYVHTIPSEFILAASSHKDKVEAMIHKTKPIFTTQFHPEKSGEHGEQMLANFLEICKLL